MYATKGSLDRHVRYEVMLVRHGGASGRIWASCNTLAEARAYAAKREIRPGLGHYAFYRTVVTIKRQRVE